MRTRYWAGGEAMKRGDRAFLLPADVEHLRQLPADAGWNVRLLIAGAVRRSTPDTSKQQ